jgi:hypothetical protein
MTPRSLALSFAVTFALGVPRAGAALCLDPPGDVDASGGTNVADVQCAIVYSLWALSGVGSAPACAPGGDAGVDASCDGQINVVDVTLVISYVLALPLGGSIDADADLCPDLCDAAGFDLAQCDAGDAAWVKRAMPFLLGRNPASSREVAVWVDLIGATDRATAARSMMAMAGYEDRWAGWFMDQVRVNRIGSKKHSTCYGSAKQPGDSGQIAAFLRDSIPGGGSPGGSYNMTDVLYSSLRLDDLTPFYRAHLFAMMAKPLTGANVAELEMDLTRRQDFGEIFSAVYTHRSVVCAGCHNSQWAVTDSGDPALDRHWPIEGLFEQAIYGNSSGRPEMEVYSMFRRLHVFSSTGASPWGIDTSCGTFKLSAQIPDDPAAYDAFFIEPRGKKATIWEVEAALHAGVEQLRDTGLEVDPATLAIGGDAAFAYLLCTRIVDQIWREATGYPLTLVNYFPRSEAQHGILKELTDDFVSEDFSLRALLADIVTHPLFNQKMPIEGCGPAAHPYILPRVFNPWSLEQSGDEVANSVGDALHRPSARVLLRKIEFALGWPAHSKWPSGAAEEFQKALGVFLKDAEPGFDGVDFQGLLTWENAYGACADQSGGTDWIDQLVAKAQAQEAAQPGSVTVRDVVLALEDRLVSEPSVPAAEAQLIAALYGVPVLDTPISQAVGWAARTRVVCGALLESPRFLLTGPGSPVDGPFVELDLTVGDTSYVQLCAQAASAAQAGAGLSVACSAGSLSVLD